MSANGYDSDDRSKEQLLAEVPADDTAIGNYALRKKLQWTDTKYWRIRDQLVAEGLLVLGRGRGGSVRRNLDEPLEKECSPDVPTTTDPGTALASEAALYGPARELIESEMAPGMGFETAPIRKFFTQITAHQGRRYTGRKWSRPDIILVGMWHLKWIPGRILDVTTFELKLGPALDVTAIYEALAHRRYSNRAYVLTTPPPNTDDFDIVREEAITHGIGLIKVGQINNYDTWEFLVEPTTTDLDPLATNDFLDTQLDEENKATLQKWLQTTIQIQHP